jgi:hypothetical protein
MSFTRPIQWCHSHADLFWPDGTFNISIVVNIQVGEDFEVPPAGLFRLNLQADLLENCHFFVSSLIRQTPSIKYSLCKVIC